MELPTVSFFGRTLAEYNQFFALDLDALRGADVLDVGAGPSSFTAEACARRIDAVAVDPFYSSPIDDLAGRIASDYERMFAQMRAKPRLFRLKSFPSLCFRSPFYFPVLPKTRRDVRRPPMQNLPYSAFGMGQPNLPLNPSSSRFPTPTWPKSIFEL